MYCFLDISDVCCMIQYNVYQMVLIDDQNCFYFLKLFICKASNSFRIECQPLNIVYVYRCLLFQCDLNLYHYLNVVISQHVVPSQVEILKPQMIASIDCLYYYNWHNKINCLHELQESNCVLTQGWRNRSGKPRTNNQYSHIYARSNLSHLLTSFQKQFSVIPTCLLF